MAAGSLPLAAWEYSEPSCLLWVAILQLRIQRRFLMNSPYKLIASRAPDRTGTLKIGYPTKELAIAAVNIVRCQWSVVTVTAPDGSLLLHFENNLA
jgi:hypothetical protein